MIEWVRIKNFQSHRKLQIVFGQVTTVTGDSDVGKSAIVRALRWVMTNQPNGDSFVRRGASECMVAVRVDGRTVTRRRGKKVNEYELDGEVFRAMGNTVPEPIAQLFNVSEINFQLQHDPAYWFHLPSSQVSRELNRIVQLDVVDKAQSAARRAVAEAKAQCTAVGGMLAADVAWLEGHEWVPAMAREWGWVAELEAAAAHKAQISLKYASALESASNHGRRRSRALKLRFEALNAVRLGEEAAQTAKTARLGASLALRVAKEGSLVGLRVLEAEAVRRGLVAVRAVEVFEAWEQASNRVAECTEAAEAVRAELRAMGVCAACGQPLLS